MVLPYYQRLVGSVDLPPALGAGLAAGAGGGAGAGAGAARVGLSAHGGVVDAAPRVAIITQFRALKLASDRVRLGATIPIGRHTQPAEDQNEDENEDENENEDQDQDQDQNEGGGEGTGSLAAPPGVHVSSSLSGEQRAMVLAMLGSATAAGAQPQPRSMPLVAAVGEAVDPGQTHSQSQSQSESQSESSWVFSPSLSPEARARIESMIAAAPKDEDGCVLDGPLCDAADPSTAIDGQ